MAAPHFAKAKGIDPELGNYGVIDSLVEASRILQTSRNKKQSVDELLSQRSMLDDFSPETEMFARYLDRNLNKSKQIGQALTELANQMEQYMQKKGQADGDLQGDSDATLDDLINRTNDELEKKYGDKTAPIKDPILNQSEKTKPLQTAERSDGDSKPEERAGRPADDAPGAKREAATARAKESDTEVDDLLDEIEQHPDDERTDEDSAGIEEEKAAYNRQSAPHYSVPGFKNLGSPERAAIKRYLDTRPDKQGIIQRLTKLADTPWARKTVQAMLIRQTIDDLIAGKNVDYRSLLSDKNNRKQPPKELDQITICELDEACSQNKLTLLAAYEKFDAKYKRKSPHTLIIIGRKFHITLECFDTFYFLRQRLHSRGVTFYALLKELKDQTKYKKPVYNLYSDIEKIHKELIRTAVDTQRNLDDKHGHESSASDETFPAKKRRLVAHQASSTSTVSSASSPHSSWPSASFEINSDILVVTIC